MTDFVTEYKEEEKQVVEVKQTNALLSRQAQEIQGAIILAKKYPRDETKAFSRIMQACKRKGLAEEAEYNFPRGAEKVQGPSIRLAEALAKAWGNIDCGVIELEHGIESSEMMSYAWDLETNTRVTKVFTVKHWRDTKKGGYALTDARDIYEATANNGARRLRACILAIIPGDIVDAAIESCRNTLKGAYTEPLIDRIRKMVVFFNEKYSVTKEMIEKYLGYNIESCVESDFLKLKNISRAITDGMAKREDYFDIAAEKVETEIPENISKVKNQFEVKKEQPKSEPEKVVKKEDSKDDVAEANPFKNGK